MEYINYTTTTNNKTVDVSSGVISLYNKLENNINQYTQYYERLSSKLPSSHILVRLCNSIMFYFGDNSTETFNNINDRLRYITSMFGIGYIGSNPEPTPLILGNDLLVCLSTPQHKTFTLDGKIAAEFTPLQVYTHNSTTIDPEYYHWSTADTEMEATSLIGINIALLGALLHEARDKQLKAELSFNLDDFLNKWLISGTTTDCINIALMNRFTNDATLKRGKSPEYMDFDIGRPYAYYDLNQEYSRLLPEFKQILKDCGGGNIADFNNNIPLLKSIGANRYIPKYNDYYLDTLMWINAYAELTQYQRINTISKAYRINWDNSPVISRLRMLVTPSRFNSYTRELPHLIRTELNALVKNNA